MQVLSSLQQSWKLTEGCENTAFFWGSPLSTSICWIYQGAICQIGLAGWEFSEEPSGEIGEASWEIGVMNQKKETQDLSHHSAVCLRIRTPQRISQHGFPLGFPLRPKDGVPAQPKKKCSFWLSFKTTPPPSNKRNGREKGSFWFPFEATSKRRPGPKARGAFWSLRGSPGSPIRARPMPSGRCGRWPGRPKRGSGDPVW